MTVLLRSIPPRIVLYGGTGQAKVVRPIVEHLGGKVVAIFDDTPDLAPPFSDVPLYQGWSGFERWLQTEQVNHTGFVITIGNPHGRLRIVLAERLKRAGLQPVTVVHQSAFVDATARLGEGAQVMAGAIICPHAVIGDQCIVNTKASVDHECILSDGVEIAPGATLCGLVQIGTGGTVYAGATVLPRIKIGADAIIGAGAVVVRDVPDGITATGVPARKLQRRKS